MSSRFFADRIAAAVVAPLIFLACAPRAQPGDSATTASDPGASPAAEAGATHAAGTGPNPDLPPPAATESATKFADVIGWSKGRMPTAPSGFAVTLYASDLKHPRWLYVLPNGDVLVAESNTERAGGLLGRSADRITLLRDADGDGRPEQRGTFLADLDQPLGMLLLGDRFYVANTNGLLRYRYRQGMMRIEEQGQKILDLPAGGYNNHWTRNVVASPDSSKLYVSVGSGTNVDEEGVDRKDERRAAILELNPDGSGMRVFASGLRNPVGLDWAPGTTDLWTVVNERDGLGDDLVPDYLTRVREGAFYGWPYSYFGQHVDPRHQGERSNLVAKAVKPDFALGAHTASLGLVFYDGDRFPERYRGGAFIGQHGSWNRSHFAGYKVAFVPFENGRPSGPLEDFLTGFIAHEGAGKVYGRPVGLAVLKDGSLLVADDESDRIWRVAHDGGSGALYQGRSAPDWIEQLQTESTPIARSEAAYALAGMGPAAREGVPALTAALKDESPNVRWAAAWALGEIGPPAASAIPALTAAQQDENGSVRWVAGRAMRHIRNTPP